MQWESGSCHSRFLHQAIKAWAQGRAHSVYFPSPTDPTASGVRTGLLNLKSGIDVKQGGSIPLSRSCRRKYSIPEQHHSNFSRRIFSNIRQNGRICPLSEASSCPWIKKFLLPGISLPPMTPTENRLCTFRQMTGHKLMHNQKSPDRISIKYKL